MILSASRRTDIPAFYSQWFINRIKEGIVYVRNPFNYNQISSIKLSPEIVDCIVFWTKNPLPLMRFLSDLTNRGYNYYFQFTLNPYEKDLEVNSPGKQELIKTFMALSSKIGKERIILRYDPIIVTEKYSLNYHLNAFEDIVKQLHNHTDNIILSFLDEYNRVSRNMKSISLVNLSEDETNQLARSMFSIANGYGLKLEACAEKTNFNDIGIKSAHCIDGELIERIIGCSLKHKDKLDGNRDNCGCMKCIDIGQYDSCIHNCLYCYANINKSRALLNYKSHDPNSRILFGDFDEKNIKIRKDIVSYKDTKAPAESQISFWQ